MLKIPSFTDALPLTLGEKLPTPNSIKPSEEWDLIRHDARGALWKNCAGGRLQFIPNPNSLSPQKPKPLLGKIPPLLQQAPDSVGDALKPIFPVGSFVRYNPSAVVYYLALEAVGCVAHINGNEIWCKWDNGEDLYWAHKDELLPCDADGWIPHTPGDPMPCDGNLEVEIMTREEAEGSIPWRPGPLPAENWEWSVNLCPSLQILAWKPVL